MHTLDVFVSIRLGSEPLVTRGTSERTLASVCETVFLPSFSSWRDKVAVRTLALDVRRHRCLVVGVSFLERHLESSERRDRRVLKATVCKQTRMKDAAGRSDGGAECDAGMGRESHMLT